METQHAHTLYKPSARLRYAISLVTCLSIFVTSMAFANVDAIEPSEQWPQHASIDDVNKGYFQRLWTAYAEDDRLISKAPEILAKAAETINNACQNKYPMVQICHVDKSNLYLSLTAFSHIQNVNGKIIWEISADMMIHSNPALQAAKKIAELMYSLDRRFQESGAAVHFDLVERTQVSGAAKKFAQELLDLPDLNVPSFKQIFLAYKDDLKNYDHQKPAQRIDAKAIENFTFEFRKLPMHRIISSYKLVPVTCGSPGMDKLFYDLPPCLSLKLGKFLSQSTMHRLQTEYLDNLLKMKQDEIPPDLLEFTAAFVGSQLAVGKMSAMISWLNRWPLLQMLVKQLIIVGEIQIYQKVAPTDPQARYLDCLRGLPQSREVLNSLLKVWIKGQYELGQGRLDPEQLRHDLEYVLIDYSGSALKFNSDK